MRAFELKVGDRARVSVPGRGKNRILEGVVQPYRGRTRVLIATDSGMYTIYKNTKVEEVIFAVP